MQIYPYFIKKILRKNQRVTGKFVIYGQYKSGTTACFLKLKNSMQGKFYTLFEKVEYDDALNTGKLPVLAKVIIPPNCQQYAEEIQYEDNPEKLMPDLEKKLGTFNTFEKKIYLVRDPRDWIISAILFLPQARSEIYMNQSCFRNVLDIIKQKESNPASVSMLDILRFMLPNSNLHNFISKFVSEQHKWLFSFEDSISNYITWKYEDMISNSKSHVEEYLGFKLSEENTSDDNYAHVARTKSYGNWKNWMTPRDVAFFRPLFAAYIERHGYDQSWDLASTPIIDSSHGSSYVERTVQLRRLKSKDSIS